MNEWLFRMLGGDEADVTRIVRASVSLRGALDAGWLILIAVVIAALAEWVYRREELSRFGRIALRIVQGLLAALLIISSRLVSAGATDLAILPCIGIVALGTGLLVAWMYLRANLTLLKRCILVGSRTLFLLLILGLLLRPMLNLVIEGAVRLPLILLVDSSNSMTIEDPRLDEADQKRAAIALDILDGKSGLGQTLDKSAAEKIGKKSRYDIVQAGLKNKRLDLLPRLAANCDVIPYRFGQKAEQLLTDTERHRGSDKPGKSAVELGGWLESAKPDSRLTAMGDSLRQVLDERKGAGILIVTDGQDNSGSDALTAAAIARTRGVPLYIWGVGSVPRDIIVNSLMAQETASAHRELPVTVRVRGQQLAGEKGRIILKLSDLKVDEQEVTFTGDEDTVNMKFTPDKAGEYTLAASIEARDDETDKSNNSARQALRVIEAKPKVLLVEQTPRWEFKYLHQMLAQPAVKAEKKEFDLKSVLFEGDPGISKGTESPFLLQFPAKKEELYAYDMVVLGDVDPKNLSSTQIEALGDFVDKFGGSLIVLAGRNYSPQAYRRTVIEKMLPVEFDPAESADAPPTDKPIKVELGPAGKASAMMKLSDKESESLAHWNQIPPIFWEFRVQRAKPGADVLLVDSDESRKTKSGKMPLMAIQQYGRGRVLYIGTDNLWRWRKNLGEGDYSRLWRQILQQMANHSNKSTQIRFDRDQRPQYAVGQKVTVYAQLYTESFEPVQDKEVKAIYTMTGQSAGASDKQLILKPTPNKAGEYAGVFYAPAPGTYQLYCERDAKTRRGFSVVDADLEMNATAMNEPLLKQMAASTGGAFFREEDLAKLPEAIAAKAERVPSGKAIDIWSSPLYFILMLAAVTAEWIVRKFSQLK